MTPSEEARLHETDRAAWLAYVAPRMAAILDTSADTRLTATWGLLPRDYQRATWPQLQPPTRERLKALRHDEGEAA